MYCKRQTLQRKGAEVGLNDTGKRERFLIYPMILWDAVSEASFKSCLQLVFLRNFQEKSGGLQLGVNPLYGNFVSIHASNWNMSGVMLGSSFQPLDQVCYLL